MPMSRDLADLYCSTAILSQNSLNKMLRTAVFVLLLFITYQTKAASDSQQFSHVDDEKQHHQHHDHNLHSHKHKHTKPTHPKHPHFPQVSTYPVEHQHQQQEQQEKQQLWAAYNNYWQLYYSKLQRSSSNPRHTDDDNDLPWYFHLFPHFPWPHIPFWPPFQVPPPPPPPPPPPVKPQAQVNFTLKDVDRINVALNVQYLQAEFFLHAAHGHGLDKLNPELAKKGPSPLGGHKARLSPRVEHVAKELGLQSAGHIRAIHDKLEGKSIRRPLINISKDVWATLINQTFTRDTEPKPPFDPYANDLNFLLAAYVIPYVGLNTLVDSSHRVTGIEARKLVAGLLGVQAAQDAVIRTMLFEVMEAKVDPYNHTVAAFTNEISNLRHKLDHTNKADEGLAVHLNRGAEKQITGNLISANAYSLSISRSPQQILQVLYGTGDASKPGSFFPNGANGQTAKVFLNANNPTKPADMEE